MYWLLKINFFSMARVRWFCLFWPITNIHWHTMLFLRSSLLADRLFIWLEVGDCDVCLPGLRNEAALTALGDSTPPLIVGILNSVLAPPIDVLAPPIAADWWVGLPEGWYPELVIWFGTLNALVGCGLTEEKRRIHESLWIVNKLVLIDYIILVK